MQTVKFNLSDRLGGFKALNATNGGPWHKRHAADQYKSNMAAYKAARIPYARNHDSGISGVYGGPYSHDISKIFRNFDADPYDAASYDFACTDEAILVALDAGTKTFFRLGETIEHQIKKHATLPPKDFKKWAVICEHIIRHYNEGWADGFRLNIKYWEIWNEPELDSDDSTNKRMWGGTAAQFFDMYEIAAKHLKSRFPELKIGGPAIAGNMEWVDEFLGEMNRRHVPIDFFSWHIYCTEPQQIIERADIVKGLLEKHGYGKAESILNEWNYVQGWTDRYIYSLEQIHGIKGAAFMLACMSLAQPSSIDMLMYYDTRPSVFNGVFDFYTARPLKGYYAMLWYGMLYDMQAEVRAENEVENIYSLCGVDKQGKATVILTHYCDDESTAAKSIAVDLGRSGKYEVYLLDAEHDGVLIDTTDKLQFDMPLYSAILIKEV